MITWELLKLGATRPKEGFGAGSVASRNVMKCRAKLDEALQKYLVRAGGGEPKLFPDFVGAEEFSGIEEFDPVEKFFGLR